MVAKGGEIVGSKRDVRELTIMTSFPPLFALPLALWVTTLNGNDWGLTTSPHFTLTYDRREEKLAGEVLRYAEEGLNRISKSLGYRPKRKVKVWLCSTEAQFDSLTRSGVPDWGIGCAFPKLGIIVLKSPRVVRRNLDLRTIVSHEISHVLLGQLLGELTPPRWFDEGLAIHQSKEWRPGDGFILGWASISNSLIPLSELESSFPTEERRANLAYTEGFSAVSFIVREYGKETLRELIASMGKGGGIDRAMIDNLGLRYDEFESLWLRFVRKSYNIPYLLSTTPFFWVGMSLLVLLIFLVRRARAKTKLAGMDLAE